MIDQEVPNKYLLDEIRLNREAIKNVGNVVSGKVGRAELFGWIATASAIMGITFRLLGN